MHREKFYIFSQRFLAVSPKTPLDYLQSLHLLPSPYFLVNRFSVQRLNSLEGEKSRDLLCNISIVQPMRPIYNDTYYTADTCTREIISSSRINRTAEYNFQARIIYTSIFRVRLVIY